MAASDKAFELAEPKPDPDTGLAWAVAVAAFGQHRAPDGSTVTLIGECPRCQAQMSTELPIKARTGAGISLKDDAQSLGKKNFTKIAYCNCGTAHEGRPDDCPNGCGAFGCLLVGGAQGAPEKGVFVSVIGQPGMAAIQDVAWERRSESEAGQTLATARAAAEKWTQTIASLTGVFSLVLLIKGPDDITKIQGTVDVFDASKVPTWLVCVGFLFAIGLLFALGVLLSKHEGSRIARWTLLGGAGATLAALVTVWAQSWSIFTLVVVLLGAAVILASAAIVAGGLAAFGLPSAFIAASGGILRQRQSKQTLLARSLLRTSLYAASATIAFVGAAIVLTWTETKMPPPDPVLIVSKASDAGPTRVLCGPIASVEPPSGLRSGTVAIDTSEGKKAPETVRIASVDQMATVSSCGSP